MAITYTMPDGTVVTTLAQVSDWVYKRAGIGTGVITNGQITVSADHTPGTARS